MRSLSYALLFSLVVTDACGWRDSTRFPDSKRIVDLSPALTEQSACQRLGQLACDFFGVPNHNAFQPVTPANHDNSFGMMTFTVLSHDGAHLDAPGRLLRNGARVDQVPLDRLIGPARLWDVRWHDRNTPLEISDLSQQPALRPEEILLLLTGYRPPERLEWPVYTWLSPRAAAWLAAQPLRALATDMPSIGSFERSAELLKQARPPEEVWAEHLPFFGKGIPVIEGLVSLEQLVDESSVVFIGFPLPIAQRSGAPMRAVALVY